MNRRMSSIFSIRSLRDHRWSKKGHLLKCGRVLKLRFY